MLVLLLAVTGAVLSGCAVAESTAHSSSRGSVAQLVRDIAHRRADDIDQWARYAENANYGYAAQITLVGIHPHEAAELTDTLGTLEFRAVSHIENMGLFAAQSQEYTGCYRVDFTRYGPEATSGGWGDRDLVDEFDCPDDVAAVAPPEDTSTVYVIPDGAEQVVSAALADAAAGATAAGIADGIRAQLAVPAGEREAAFPVDVVVTADGSIGVAMGDADDCLLVQRVDGVVATVSAPRVYLQPGELGCRAGTALADLTPPH